MAIKRKFPPRVATVYCSGGCRAKKDEDGGKIVQRGTHDELMKNCGVYREIAMSQLSEEFGPRGGVRLKNKNRGGFVSPPRPSFGMRTLTAAHRCENGEDVSAKLRVHCLDNYHAQHYNKTHKKPPFAAFLRIGG